MKRTHREESPILDYDEHLDQDISDLKRRHFNDEFRDNDTLDQLGKYMDNYDALCKKIGHDNAERIYRVIRPLGAAFHELDPKLNFLEIRRYSWLHYAILNNHVELTVFLCKDPIIRAAIDYRLNGWTWLHMAASVAGRAVILSLLQAGANINAITDTGETALYLATTRGNVKAVKVLRDYGCIDAPCRISGRTAINIAQSYLLPNHRVSEEKRELYRKIIAALQRRVIARRISHHVNVIVEHNLNTQLHCYSRALNHQAVWGFVRSRFRQLINFNQLNAQGETPLMSVVLAEVFYHIPDKMQLFRAQYETIQALLAAGANLAARDRFERTALDLCITNGCWTAFKVLLNSGADPLTLETFRRSLVRSQEIWRTKFAIDLYFMHIRSINSLSKYSFGHLADDILQDNTEENLPYADECFLVRILNFYRHIQPLKRILEFRNLKGETPLMIALRLNKFKEATFLISLDVNLYIENKLGESVLDYANKYGDFTVKNIIQGKIKTCFKQKHINKLEYLRKHNFHQESADYLYKIGILSEERISESLLQEMVQHDVTLKGDPLVKKLNIAASRYIQELALAESDKDSLAASDEEEALEQQSHDEDYWTQIGLDMKAEYEADQQEDEDEEDSNSYSASL